MSTSDAEVMVTGQVESSNQVKRASQQRLQSADLSTLLILSTSHSTMDDRAFPATAAKPWNSLPAHVRDATSLLAFSRQLKTMLFRLSYADD